MIPKNKRISILHPYVNTRGGAVNMMIYLSNLLKEEGNSVTFYTLSYDAKLFSKDINFEIVSSNKISIAYKIRKSDYIIIGNSPMQFVGAISKILFFSNAQVIWWHHHYPWYYDKNTNFLLLIKRALEKFSLKFIDLILVNSVYLQKSVKTLYSINSKVLYPIVNPQFIRNNTKNIKEKELIIFTYSRWVQGKNIEQIFDTYEFLQGKIKNFHLLVGGEGEEIYSFKEKFKTDKKISFLGLLDTDSIIKYLKKSSLFLFPSLIDSFGMAIIEAQSLGVPVVAFDKNGAREIIINGKTGFLVKTSQEFNEKSLFLLENLELIKTFSENAILLGEKFGELNFKKTLMEIF